MDTKFASAQALMDLSQKLDAMPETVAIKVQKELLKKKLQDMFDQLMLLGVSLPDLFEKFSA
jgi:hypothetical protein